MTEIKEGLMVVTAILVAMVKAIMCNMIGVRRLGLVVVIEFVCVYYYMQSVIYLKMIFYVFFNFYQHIKTKKNTKKASI
jgi:mannose/fructose/N-acetylgalactosamine-specific phosphotransferase system component IIC